jgi:YD repeat-containing protein
MATVALTTTPVQIDDGTSYTVLVTNTGAVEVDLSRGGRLRPQQSRTVYPEGTALTAAATSGTGTVTTSTTSKPLPNAADPAALAANAAFTGTYASLNPVASSYTFNGDGTVSTETVAGVTTTYTYNADGTVATSARSGVTRTYTYNPDGTIASVA